MYFLLAFIMIWFFVFLKNFSIDDISTLDFKNFHIKNKLIPVDGKSLYLYNKPLRTNDFSLFIDDQKSLSVLRSEKVKAALTLHSIQFGIFLKAPIRTPSVMIRTEIGPALLQKFQSLPMFSCPEPDLESFGMNQAVDYPRSPKHVYHEGYYHTLLTQKSQFSRNPRSGVDFQKPAAGEFLCYFYETMRRVNKALFTNLSNQLWQSALSRNPDNPEMDICGLLSKWIAGGFHFGDLSVQIHYGTAISHDQLFWHSDAENSLLHLCLTVRGRRWLHSKRAASAEEMVQEVLEEQSPGSLYLSTSALINHAPEYPEARLHKHQFN